MFLCRNGTEGPSLCTLWPPACVSRYHPLNIGIKWGHYISSVHLYDRCVHVCVFQVLNTKDELRRPQSCPFVNTGVTFPSFFSSLYLLLNQQSEGWSVHLWYTCVSFVSTPDSLRGNVWQNVSVSMRLGQVNNAHSMLRWNLSAPCRLEGEVWLCHNELPCREVEGFRQQLATSTWRQNSQGQWVRNIILNHAPPLLA